MAITILLTRRRKNPISLPGLNRKGWRTRLTCDSGAGLSCLGEDEGGIIIVDKGCDWLEPTVACCLVNAISGWCSEIYLEELG